MPYTLAQTLSMHLEAIRQNGYTVYAKHRERIEDLCKEYMPSGDGFDSGTKLAVDLSHSDKLVFMTSYHHKDEMGYPNGWTHHTVTVRPAFKGFRISSIGSDRDDRDGMRQHIAKTFSRVLSRKIDDREDRKNGLLSGTTDLLNSMKT